MEFAVYLSEQRTRRIVVEAESQRWLEGMLAEATDILPLDEMAEGIDYEHGCVVDSTEPEAERVVVDWIDLVSGGEAA